MFWRGMFTILQSLIVKKKVNRFVTARSMINKNEIVKHFNDNSLLFAALGGTETETIPFWCWTATDGRAGGKVELCVICPFMFLRQQHIVLHLLLLRSIIFHFLISRDIILPADKCFEIMQLSYPEPFLLKVKSRIITTRMLLGGN